MNLSINTVPIALLLVCGAACAPRTRPEVHYAKAAPLADPPRQPAVVQVPKPLPLPGQLRPIPQAEPPAAPPPPPCLTDDENRGGKGQVHRNHEKCNDVAGVIDDANRKASQNPEEAGFFNAIQTYTYDPGALYQVYTAPMRLTMISLQPGEKLIGPLAFGDTLQWKAGVVRSMADGVVQQHIYLKPTRPNLQTSMVFTTDHRIYYLELKSFKTTYMAGVSWRYPQDEVAQLEAQTAERDAAEKVVTASNINLEAANFSYQISVKNGHPRWTPEQVFDDGRRTYVRFPRSMLVREAPALFVLSSAHDAQLVNYRVKNEFYIVDRLFEEAELRLGQQDQEIVRITRK